MKTTVYRNLVVTACSLGLLGLLAGCLGMSISFESANPDASSSLPTEIQQSPQQPGANVAPGQEISTSNSSPATTLTSQAEHSSTENPGAVWNYRFNSADKADKAKTQGTLRVSNRTNQPLRLALLARQPAGKKSSVAKANYDIPAHWDFAPQEGSEKGLILSLPQGKLKLEKGDILVAFAQDGSRRYWGPYVVGETSFPAWNSQNKEWGLVLSQ